MAKSAHRCITVTLSIAKWGRMVRVTSPRGECGKPYQSDNHDHILDYVASMVRFETQRVLHDLDDEVKKRGLDAERLQRIADEGAELEDKHGALVLVGRTPQLSLTRKALDLDDEVKKT